MRYIITILFIFLLVSLGLAQDSDPSELIPDLVTELNLWRLNIGLEVLTHNETLEAMAVSQADYLLSLDSLPNDLHIGASGEDARARSQLEAFAWPTYGHPELFAVTEIIAIGSIESAIRFWRGSDIHNRSVTNPQYREVGVAARQLGSDVMFVVVLGAQPDVLPALADVDTEKLYLTSERGEWTGGWMGIVTRYRFLDLEFEPITVWQEWEYEVDLPEVETDSFYIQYEDDDGNRITTEVPLQPIWSLSRPSTENTDVVEAEVTSEATPETESAVVGFPTNTPIPTATPIPTMTATPVPTATPLPRGLQIIYDEDVLTVLNNSSLRVDLYNLRLQQGDKIFNALTWEQVVSDLNIGSLPSGHCLQIAGFNTSEGITEIAECALIRSLVTISEEQFFWVEGTFEVLIGDERIATCDASVGTCTVTLP